MNLIAVYTDSCHRDENNPVKESVLDESYSPETDGLDEMYHFEDKDYPVLVYVASLITVKDLDQSPLRTMIKLSFGYQSTSRVIRVLEILLSLTKTRDLIEYWIDCWWQHYNDSPIPGLLRLALSGPQKYLSTLLECDDDQIESELVDLVEDAPLYEITPRCLSLATEKHFFEVTAAMLFRKPEFSECVREAMTRWTTLTYFYQYYELVRPWRIPATCFCLFTAVKQEEIEVVKILRNCGADLLSVADQVAHHDIFFMSRYYELLDEEDRDRWMRRELWKCLITPRCALMYNKLVSWCMRQGFLIAPPEERWFTLEPVRNLSPILGHFYDSLSLFS